MVSRKHIGKNALTIAAVLLLLGGTVSVTTSSAGAWPSPVDNVIEAVTQTKKKQTAKIQQYCKQKLSGKARDACNTKDMGTVRDAAAAKCKGKKGKNAETCIQKSGQDIINEAASKNPKTQQAATNAIVAAVGGGGGGGGGGGAGGGGGGGAKKPTSIPTTTPTTDISSSGLPQVKADTNNVKNLLQIFFGIIGAFALFSITASGLKYITSAGDPQKTSEAKNGIIYSVVGLLIALTAEAIVAFVVKGT